MRATRRLAHAAPAAPPAKPPHNRIEAVSSADIRKPPGVETKMTTPNVTKAPIVNPARIHSKMIAERNGAQSLSDAESPSCCGEANGLVNWELLTILSQRRPRDATMLVEEPLYCNKVALRRDRVRLLASSALAVTGVHGSRLRR